MDVTKQFSSFLKQEKKSANTIQGYTLNIRQYIKWFEGSYDRKLTSYISYLKNVKMLNAKTINHKISSLAKFNEFLIKKGSQQDQVILKTDTIKVQTAYASPPQIVELDVKKFLQSVLEDKNKRNYTIVTLLAYTGVRISEALFIKLNDFNLQTGECVIRSGKGGKQRIVLLNSKAIRAIKDYLIERKKYSTAHESTYHFISKKWEKLDVRSSIVSLNHIASLLLRTSYDTSSAPMQLKKDLVFTK